jgi:transposase InsO family protein
MSEEGHAGKALFRYQVISPLLALDLPRGQRRNMYRELAAREWPLAGGETLKVSEESIRRWLRLYRREGFEGLKDHPRHHKGSEKALPDDLITTICKLKMEVPERSLDRLITIIEEMGMAPAGVVKRSTLHRELQDRGLSMRKAVAASSTKDLARWQADYANDLWQSDMLEGPWLSDPDNPEKSRKTRLYAFIDDASRFLLCGRFFFKGDLPALELVFRTALLRYGLCRSVYYDNAQTYRSTHMRIICAEIGIHRPIYAMPYKPEGKGKIEAWNRFCTSNFLAEIKASSIQTLDDLNVAFHAWVEEEYNRRVHSELGCSPKERWLRDRSRIRYVDEEKLRTVFLWREERRADKCGIVHLFGEDYRVSPRLSGKKVQIRYEPEHLEHIEIWSQGKFQERIGVYRPAPHRPPREQFPQNPNLLPAEKTDYLGWLVKKHQAESAASGNGFDTFMEIFQSRLVPEVIDKEALQHFYVRFAPIDVEKLTQRLESILASHPDNLHIAFYLEALEGSEAE